ncbi:hypothetical protein [Microbacterium sp. W4I20]|uniref:hypothetical protein n=1 Tax=Microbacterium sp. W4I20 TaxID=3042262 RepID=UPI002784B4B9|nr:hypothetical protein [Microbacterium sp. W4I20]MDQ0726789.1 hypothetical protein [Microbacterium sp. W4I20]
MVVINPGTSERNHRDGIWCDPCLEPLIRALNTAGVATVASCCGHGTAPTWVSLKDGRDLVVFPDHPTTVRTLNPHADLTDIS